MATFRIMFNRHENPIPQKYIDDYVKCIIGEPSRRGNQRTVIGENNLGERTDLAIWNENLGPDGYGRWMTTDDSEIWEDVRAELIEELAEESAEA